MKAFKINDFMASISEETYKIKDIMVPISEYATVFEDASLYDAILALERAQGEFDRNHYTHRAILVYNQNQKIVGKLSQLDVIKAIEPKYMNMNNHAGMSRYGFSKKFTQSLMRQYKLWEDSLENACKKASQVKVSEIMYTLTDKEYVKENASLGEAVHMLIMGRHQSLLVTRGNDIVGILRLTDVFASIFHIMKRVCDR